MTAEWTHCKLGDLITLQRGFDLPQGQRIDGPYPILSSSGVTGHHIESKVAPPGVVTGRYGTIGKVFFTEQHFWPLNTSLWVKDFKGNHPRFIYYLLQTVDFFAHMDKSGVPGINRNHVHLAEVIRPPLPEQQAIAHILGTLDDKIELNRRMNKTLEGIARIIFKSWFVDFEPIPGMEPHAEWKDSVLGKIPKDWFVSPVDSIAARVAMGPFGSRITKDNFLPEGVPVIRGTNLVGGFNENNFVFLTEEKADELKSSNAFPGDLIFTHRGTLGQVGLIPENAKYPRYVVSQSQMVLTVDKRQASPNFMYHFFCSQTGQHSLLGNTSTTGVPAIARPVTSLKSISLVLPDKKVSDLFESTTAPMTRKHHQNYKEINLLVYIRDTLLPKLLSGEIRIKDADKIVSRAV